MKKLIFSLVLCVATAAQAHGPYTHWLQKDEKTSCCNDIDCSPAQDVRYFEGQYAVLWRGHWYAVPADAVRPYESPDGLNHACVAQGKVICFVPGGGT